jgi:hypothetical protein
VLLAWVGGASAEDRRPGDMSCIFAGHVPIAAIVVEPRRPICRRFRRQAHGDMNRDGIGRMKVRLFGFRLRSASVIPRPHVASRVDRCRPQSRERLNESLKLSGRLLAALYDGYGLITDEGVAVGGAFDSDAPQRSRLGGRRHRQLRPGLRCLSSVSVDASGLRSSRLQPRQSPCRAAHRILALTHTKPVDSVGVTTPAHASDGRWARRA